MSSIIHKESSWGSRIVWADFYALRLGKVKKVSCLSCSRSMLPILVLFLLLPLPGLLLQAFSFSLRL